MKNAALPASVALVASFVLWTGTSPVIFGQQTGEGSVVTLDGLKSRAPAEWVEEPTRGQFRVKQFRLSAVGDDKENAQLLVFHFGPRGGGSVSENIKRWKGMFLPPEGKTIEEVAKLEKLKIGEFDYTYFDVHGTYKFKARPIDTETTPYPNYRMLAGVFETKNGPYFFRLVGPADTVKHYKSGFDQWLKGFK